MSWDYGNYDLTDCDREPIHQIGKIQPFGALIAVRSDWVVAHRSVNCAEILGLKETPEVGNHLNGWFSDNAIRQLTESLSLASENNDVRRIFGIRLRKDGEQFDVAIHQSGSLTIIEAEPHCKEDYTDHISLIGPLMSQLEPIKDLDALSEKAAKLVKDLVGFDRVMVYRFHPDESGEVIAEAKEDNLSPFLKLRFPQTDIPQQARELFKRNRFRIISDMNAEQVPIEPAASIDGEPIDLSMSTLRAHSEMHVEYMKNMGVDASLSIAIVVKNRLWGLFACHHHEPRVLPYSLRTVAELFSQMFSLMLERNYMDLADDIRDRGRKLHDLLMVRMAGGETLPGSLPMLDKLLETVIPHDGSSVFVDGSYQSRGSAPNEEEFQAIMPALNGAPTSKVIATDSLAGMIKSAKPFADRAAGALIIPISRNPRDYLLLWRREEAQNVTWAGKPEKEVVRTETGVRLSPRKSFEAWEESVSGKCAEWSSDEQEIAESIRVTLLEVILRLTDEAVQERKRAQEQQELLIAELNHRVRNILNLIRSLVSQSQHDAQDIPDYSRIIGGRITALATAHDNITKQNWSPAPISALIEAEVEAYLQEKKERLDIQGEDVLIAPEAYTVLALVMHEMVTNSAKYGSLCDRRGNLSIDLKRDDDGDLRIAWRESGGPEVREPTRRGFGSTIIERSIPFELKGEAQVRYEPSGLEADFVVPAYYVRGATPAETPTTSVGRDKKADENTAKSLNVPKHVLVVEDSMIIALDTEESLKILGVPNVVTANSVHSALECIKKQKPDFAIVDFNLGSETSQPVIEELQRLAIPHVLATGYGDNSLEIGHDYALGLITKPYGKAEIESVLAKLD